MKIDLRRIETRHSEQEKEIGQVTASLEGTLAQFKEALEFRRRLRERLVDSSGKVSQRRAETAETFKSVIRKLDRARRGLADGEEELKRMKKDEAVARGKYKELLMSRIPSSPEEAEAVMSEDAADLAGVREKFMERLAVAFGELETEITGMKGRREGVAERMASNEREVGAYHSKSQILSRTMELYKGELADDERQLSATIEEEELLIREYIDFTERLNAVASIPPSMERILRRNLDAAHSESGERH